MKETISDSLGFSSSQRKFVVSYIVGVFLVLFVFSVAAFVVDYRAVVQNERFFNEQQSLQTFLVKQAIEDHVSDTFVDIRILVKYCVTGYLVEEQAETNLERMFVIDIQEDPEKLGYFYFETPDELKVSYVVTSPAGAVARQIAADWVMAYWDVLPDKVSELYVPPFHITREYQMFGILYPVMENGQIRGVLMSVIDFTPLLQRYIVPMRSGNSGAAYVLDGQGTIIFDHETEIIGRSVFDGMHANYPSLLEIDQRLVNESQGMGAYRFTVQRGGNIKRKLIAWHALQIGKQKFIIALSAPDSEIGDALTVLREQRIVLSVVLILALLLMSTAFFYTRQRFLKQNALRFRTLMEQRTAELVASEARYRTITELTPDAMIVHRDNVILFANQAAADLTGASNPEALVGKAITDFGVPEGSLRSAGMQLTALDRPLVRVNGQVLFVATSTAEIVYQGQPAVLSIMRDVTERKQAAEALLRLSTAVKMTADSVIISDLEGWIIEVNEAALALYGQSDGLGGKNVFDLMVSEDRSRAIANAVEAFESGAVTNQEYQILVKDGHIIPVEVTISVMNHEDGAPVGLVLIIRDITERKLTEAILRDSEERYRSFVQNFQGIAFRGLMDFSILFFHGAVETITGYTEEDFSAGTPRWNSLILPQDRKKIAESVEKIKKTPNYATEREYRIVRKDGKVRWVREHIQNVTDENGVPSYVQGAIYDISEFKRVEAERTRLLIAEHEQRLLAETLTEVTLALTSQTNHELILDEFLRQVQRVVPFTTTNIALLEEDILRVVRWQGYDVFDVETFIETFAVPVEALPLDAAVITTQEAILLSDVREDDRWRVFDETAWIQSVLVAPICLRDRVLGVLHLDGDTPDQFSALDVERLQPLLNAAAIAIENAMLLRDLENEVTVRAAEIIAERDKNDAILRSVGDAIAVVGVDLHIQYVNEAFVTQTGYVQEEVLGQNLSFLISNRVPVQSAQDFRQVLGSGEGWAGELTLQRKDGRVYDAALTVAPIHNASGGLLGYVVSHQDISRFKALDKARSQFMFHISQQLRTPVTTLELYTHLLKSQELSAVNLRYLQALDVQIDQLAHLTQDILEITALDSGQAVQKWEPVSLSYLIGNLDVRYQDRATISDLTLDVASLPADLPIIKGDQERLGQALGEIIENALTFTPKGGKITVTVKTAVGETWNGLAIVVQDTGPGLTVEEQERVFERFYRGRLTEAGNIPGTGLGLSIAEEIVNAHGGYITVQSAVNQGAIFTIWLPQAV